MKPVVIETSCELAADPAPVWRLITDWERQSDWMLEMSDVVVTSPHREGVGVTAEASIKIGGIRTRDVVRVDVWDEPHHIGLVHEGWVGGRGDIRLSGGDSNGTRLHWREELYPPWGFVGAIGLRIFRPLLRRVFDRDLQVLQRLVRDDL